MFLPGTIFINDPCPCLFMFTLMKMLGTMFTNWIWNLSGSHFLPVIVFHSKTYPLRQTFYILRVLLASCLSLTRILILLPCSESTRLFPSVGALLFNGVNYFCSPDSDEHFSSLLFTASVLFIFCISHPSLMYFFELQIHPLHVRNI
jgi:hypothetical protein